MAAAGGSSLGGGGLGERKRKRGASAFLHGLLAPQRERLSLYSRSQDGRKQISREHTGLVTLCLLPPSLPVACSTGIPKRAGHLPSPLSSKPCLDRPALLLCPWPQRVPRSPAESVSALTALHHLLKSQKNPHAKPVFHGIAISYGTVYTCIH